MRRILTSTAAAALAMSLTAGAIAADPPATKKAKKPLPVQYPTLEIGAQAPEFKLPGVDGRTYSLGDFDDAKVLVVLFNCNHCPTAQAYEERIKKLHADYRNKGVALVVISPNDPQALRLDELGYTDVSDSFEDMKVRAKDAGFTFPYLYDGDTQEVSKAYGVVATPHAYVFDRSRKLRYVGRIDDAEVKEVTSHDLTNAVDALLAGRPVPVETTRVFGCSTKWSDKRKEAKLALEKADAETATLETIDDDGVAKLARNDTDKYVLVNLWATWCGPCVSELPELTAMHRMYRRRPFQMVTISMDEPEKRAEALKVLNEHHLSATNYILNTKDRDKFAEALDKEWPGALPYTVLIAPGGKVVYRKSGSIEPLELKRAIVEGIGRTYAARAK
jgi:peroxiredoxin